MTHQFMSRRTRLLPTILSLLVVFTVPFLHAQTAPSKIEGTVMDSRNNAITGAVVTVTNPATGATRNTRVDAAGHYAIEGLPDGTYNVAATASGFADGARTGVVLASGQTQQVAFSMSISEVTQEVTVNAGIDSVAAQAAPSGGFIEERSAQSIIPDTYIENFTSPIADYGEVVQIVPGAFTTSSNGVGLGQSKTYFRGFQDGDYDIDFDGIPFYDTNSPTHHSWAFFPSQWLGGTDFDRSPGTASTIGPTPFGGSIHLLSKPLTNELDARFGVSYGTWNTELYDGSFNSGPFGLFGHAPKSNLFADVHHMSSDGYQSFNYNLRSGGSLLYQYTFSPRTILTGFSGVIILNSNGPNISSTRCMLYGVSSTNAYSCANADTANGLQPYTGAGLKFLLTNNSDPTSWFDYRYNTYQVPTDFEYVGVKSELGHGWYLDVKPYTYNYDNGELYSNATPITEATTQAAIPGSIVVGGKVYYDGALVAPCDVQVVKKGIAALPCGIDKYNSYRKYGETALLTQTSKFGIARMGMWYEWARTNRHQYPSDPLNNWADQPLSKFNEQFWTNSYQPYAEYDWHALPRLDVTAGTKFAAYSINVLHHADDGATVGELTCTSTTAACPATISNSGNFTAWLPSLDANFRIKPFWSVYGQGSTGSVVPPSAVYDYNQTAASASAAVPQLTTPPKQQRSTTYQIGSVFKGNRFTLDLDAYHIRFQNSYSSTIDNIAGDVDFGDTIFYLQPSSISKGLEMETTIVVVPGLTAYLNGTLGRAFYTGTLNAGTQTTPYTEHAPSGLWVAQTPTDTEMEGLTYQKHGFDLGVFNKRVGEEEVDGGAYHNQALINPFNSLGGYFNYTVRNHSIFDQTKIRLDGTNLLDSHNVQSLTLAGTPVAPLISGTSLTNQFVATTPINGADAPSLMAGRSFSVSVTFGIAPRERK
jgi:iron complex outermembrane receptor protein